MKTILVGDFDFSVTNIVIAHRSKYRAMETYDLYTRGRGISGLVYCIQGEAEYLFPEAKLVLRAGDMIFLSKDWAYTVRCAQDFHHITVNFDLQEEGAPFRDIIDFGEKTPRRVSLEVFDAGERLGKIVQYWKEKPAGYRVQIKSILYGLLYDYFVACKQKNYSADYVKVMPAKHLLDERYAEDLPIAELAAACRFSESHFRQAFRNVFHCSPTEYRLEIRLRKAKDLLLSREFSVSEVALAVGFPDANYFSRIFKAREGVTPSTYGKQPIF